MLAVQQGRQAAGRKEEANAVSPIVVPMRHEASKRLAELPVGAGGEFF